MQQDFAPPPPIGQQPIVVNNMAPPQQPFVFTQDAQIPQGGFLPAFPADQQPLPQGAFNFRADPSAQKGPVLRSGDVANTFKFGNHSASF